MSAAPLLFAKKGVILNLYDAIYTRQSVDRIDSISVESQAEFCKKEVIDGQFRLYSDKGYGGKNIDRPAFKELLGDIESGKVRRVIVYRLDRISRSVLDFANVIDVFQKHRVDFVSTMEKFDTGTPIGKAMLMIVMIFAQLERETIQQRVIDAYASRSKRGFYMGGRIPFGFTLKETMID
ncbi:MAG: recombinase family protein [Ruminococcaceae bacterium]|nr:recombinase family protein [Oscillospiraceae bacterium]